MLEKRQSPCDEKILEKILEQILGYLNFSSGAEDPQFLKSLNLLYLQHVCDKQVFCSSRDKRKASARSKRKPVSTHSAETSLQAAESDTCGPWRTIHHQLQTRLTQLSESSIAFQDCSQGTAVLQIVFDQFLGQYLEFHRDLLFHQTPAELFNPFLIGRIFERVLQQGPPWNESERIVRDAQRVLDDYIGYRPVATLESQKIEPYPHEWVRSIPIYISGVGAVAGPLTRLIELTMEILAQAGPDVLSAAHFNPALMDELSVDPRAYDFDHPVNRRPNHHFGLWDPRHIDGNGRYRRFVVQQVTLNALVQRHLEGDLTAPDATDEELLYEAAAVLAGTILMGSGISGEGPTTFDSNVSLADLMPIIAGYRDTFYTQLLDKLTGAHGQRLREEAIVRRQPFGAARQHLNAKLAQLRAAQMQHVHLANIFARMGYPDAAKRQANIIPVASARMISRIDCRLTAGRQSIMLGDLATGLKLLEEIFDLLKRAIDCGAMIDPWNILGFDANFSLFPAMENSIRDHRADELVDLVEDLFSYCSLLWSEAAARGDEAAALGMDTKMREIVNWWNQFAIHEVSSVDAADGNDVYEAARNVASALKLWHEKGAESSDVRFWAEHSDLFESPRSYAIVIDTLIERDDAVASMALLVHWLSQVENVPLEEAGNSFPALAQRWMHHVISRAHETADKKEIDAETWQRLIRFLDYIEANAEQFWEVPDFQIGAAWGSEHDSDAELETSFEPEDENPFSAAYDDMVFRDSSDDGREGQIYDTDSQSDSELDQELRRLEERFVFLNMTATLWQIVAAVSTPIGGVDADKQPDFAAAQDASLRRLLELTRKRQTALLRLLKSLQNHRLPELTGDYESMTNYDRHRWFKEHLLDRVIECYVHNAHSMRTIMAAILANTGSAPASDGFLEDDQIVLVELLGAVLAGRTEGIDQHWDRYLELLKSCSVSYIPLSRNGDPRRIALARSRQDAISHLLEILPRMGMFYRASELIDAVREMERTNPVGNGALTEFDDLYQKGFEALAQALIYQTRANLDQSREQAEAQAEAKSTSGKSTEPRIAKASGTEKKLSIKQSAAAKPAPEQRPTPPQRTASPDQNRAELLSQRLEQLTEPLLVSWLEHSRTLRLSVLERVVDEKQWNELVKFIQDFGEDLFTQGFFGLGNLRAILHLGVAEWFDLMEQSGEADEYKLLRALNESNRAYLANKLTMVLEAIIENYSEYRDYNSTTTQSDRGEMLYMLLDFLRLRMRYDRIAWHLNPVRWAHRVLVEMDEHDAAKYWRRSLKDRVRNESRNFLKQLTEMQKKYAMRMPTVADRLEERFLKPLEIDRLRSLIPRAMEEIGSSRSKKAFKALEKEVDVTTKTPIGVGLEVPQWIVELQDEVDNTISSSREDLYEVDVWVKRDYPSSEEEISDQLARIARRFQGGRVK
jgi:hypothetical protein